MHRDIADMDHIDAPAILAYRGGDVFATIVDILRNIPRGRPCSANSLEDLLKMYVFSIPDLLPLTDQSIQEPCTLIDD